MAAKTLDAMRNELALQILMIEDINLLKKIKDLISQETRKRLVNEIRQGEKDLDAGKGIEVNVNEL